MLRGVNLLRAAARVAAGAIVTALARWESRSGKWYAEVRHLSGRGYAYEGNGCCGVFYVDSDADAIAYTEDRIATGIFQPDANTSPLRRVAIGGQS